MPIRMDLMGFALVAAMLVMGARWLLPKLQARTPKGRERAAFRALLKACMATTGRRSA